LRLDVVGEPTGAKRRSPLLRRSSGVQRLRDSLERLIGRRMSAAAARSSFTASRSSLRARSNADWLPPRSASFWASSSFSPARRRRRTSTSRRRASWFTAHAGTVGFFSCLTAGSPVSFASALRAEVNSSSGSS
jgi:hypothetical protein